jgi:hypothetical protein
MSANDEVARYREAARLALQQLEFCVVYLHGIGKTQIARALEKNRSAIADTLADINTEPPV